MTMKLLGTVTVGAGGSTTIDFTNIPQTYNDLFVVYSVRTAYSANYQYLVPTMNTLGTTTGRTLHGNGSSVISNTSPWNESSASGSTATANTFSNGYIYFPNYTSAVAKTAQMDSVTENAASSSGCGTATLYFGNTTTAATQVGLYAAGQTMVQYSTASLYGITRGTKIDADAGGGMLAWDFLTGTEGWTFNSVNASVSNSILTYRITTFDPMAISPGFSISGSAYRYVNVKIKRVNSGQGNWDGSLFYSTTSHGFSEAYKGLMPQPTWDGTYKIIRMDMHSLHSGGNDWANSTITQIRLDFGDWAGAQEDYLIDAIWLN